MWQAAALVLIIIGIASVGGAVNDCGHSQPFFSMFNDSHTRCGLDKPREDAVVIFIEPDEELAAAPTNYAAQDCGASISGHSENVKSASNVLTKASDTYAVLPCHEQKEHHLTIKLCRAVVVTSIQVTNNERFSSRVKTVELWGRREKGWPWERLGRWTLEDRLGTQTLDVADSSRLSGEVMLRVQSRYGMQFYCPITSIVVFGQEEQVAPDEEDDDEDDEDLVVVGLPGAPMKEGAPNGDHQMMMIGLTGEAALRAEIAALTKRVAALEKRCFKAE